MLSDIRTVYTDSLMLAEETMMVESDAGEEIAQENRLTRKTDRSQRSRWIESDGN